MLNMGNSGSVNELRNQKLRVRKICDPLDPVRAQVELQGCRGHGFINDHPIVCGTNCVGNSESNREKRGKATIKERSFYIEYRCLLYT